MIDRTISHYKILEKLGEGGMGIVYKALDKRLNRTVAMKFLSLHNHLNDEDKTRFITEAQAAAALNHPNICTVHEIDEAEGRIFIVMEYVEGRSLEDRMQSGPLSLGDALDIAIQIAEGLHNAHQRGIIHRDIKASNIMLTDKGRAKIMDFGLAKVRGAKQITKAHQMMGTVFYMSPEQASVQPIDHRTDIWSLGILLYKMLTGQLPFRGEVDASVVYAILNENPKPIVDLRPGVPMRLVQVVSDMLEKERDQRIQSVGELLKGLRDARAAIRGPHRTGTEKAIAVLPFRDISPGKESDYFSDGLTEELLISLSKLKGMRVLSRTTCMRYKGTTKDARSIGLEIGARYLLEGSVRRLQEDLRISVQLIDVESDTQLWAETYRGSLADVFEIQEKVSRQIVDALLLRMTPSEKVVLGKRSTLNPEAFDLYLRARDLLYQLTKDKIKAAIQLLEKAIELDPRYAAAYAGLGEAYATLYQNYDRNQTLLEKSIDACLGALMYDSSLSEAYAALGLSYFNKKEIEEAFEASQRAIELDPNSFTGYWILGRISHSMGRDKDAVDCFERVIVLNPDFYTAYKDLAMSYEQLGQMDDYNRVLKASAQIYPQYFQRHPDDGRAHMYYAVNLAELGRIEEAKSEASKALELSPTDPLMYYNAACFYSRIGEKRLAVYSLKGAVDSGFEYFDWIKTDPDLENIRNEPGYIQLLKGR